VLLLANREIATAMTVENAGLPLRTWRVAHRPGKRAEFLGTVEAVNGRQPRLLPWKRSISLRSSASGWWCRNSASKRSEHVLG
jgi:hypothetical protein